MRLLVAVTVVATLPACGGGGNGGGGSVVNPSAPVTTMPPVSYSGTYSGSMCVTGAGVACLPVTARTTTSHTGNALTFGNLAISGAVNGTFGGAQAVLSGNTFTGTGSYNAGCGVATTLYTGYFSGDGRVMNLRVNLGGCADLQFLGEVSR